MRMQQEQRRRELQISRHHRLVDGNRVQQVTRGLGGCRPLAFEGALQNANRGLEGVSSPKQEGGSRLPSAYLREEGQSGAGDRIRARVAPEACGHRTHHPCVDQFRRSLGL